MARIVGYVCPPGTPTAGNRNRVEHCLGACPHPCVVPPLLAKMFDADVGNHHTGNYISASMLTPGSCPRQTIFERNVEFYSDPTKRWWPFRGTIIHALVEGAQHLVAPHGWMQELRMSVALTFPELPAPVYDADGKFTGAFDHARPLVIVLGGTTDAYAPLRRMLADLKSMADIKVENFAKAGVIEDKFTIQLNVYRWLIANTRITPELAERCRAVGFDPTGHEFLPAPEELIIQGISMMAVPRSGMTNNIKVKKAGSKFKKFELCDIEAVPVWPLEETEAFIRPRVLQWYRWMQLGEQPPVVPEEDQWLCNGCAFNGELPGQEGQPCHPEAERAHLVQLELDRAKRPIPPVNPDPYGSI